MDEKVVKLAKEDIKRSNRIFKADGAVETWYVLHQRPLQAPTGLSLHQKVDGCLNTVFLEREEAERLKTDLHNYLVLSKALPGYKRKDWRIEARTRANAADGENDEYWILQRAVTTGGEPDWADLGEIRDENLAKLVVELLNTVDTSNGRWCV